MQELVEVELCLFDETGEHEVERIAKELLSTFSYLQGQKVSHILSVTHPAGCKSMQVILQSHAASHEGVLFVGSAQRSCT